MKKIFEWFIKMMIMMITSFMEQAPKRNGQPRFNRFRVTADPKRGVTIFELYNGDR